MVDPVSMQNVVVRSSEVAKIQRVQDEKSSLQAQAFAAELQRQAQRAEEEIDPHQKTYHADKDQHKRKESHSVAKGKGKGEKREGEQPEEGSSGHLIDVRA